MYSNAMMFVHNSHPKFSLQGGGLAVFGRCCIGRNSVQNAIPDFRVQRRVWGRVSVLRGGVWLWTGESPYRSSSAGMPVHRTTRNLCLEPGLQHDVGLD